MAEKEEEGGSKASEVVPMFFFDLIARVVPGLFLLFGIYLIAGEGLLGAIGIHHVIRMKDPSFASILLWILAGYTTGHIISPLVKTLEHLADNKLSHKAAGASKQSLRSGLYNDLRLLCPSVTNITMRIRAEYIMYGGFCVAFACFGYLADSLTPLLLPSYEDVVGWIANIPLTLGEPAIILWLLIRGAKDQPLKAAA